MASNSLQCTAAGQGSGGMTDQQRCCEAEGAASLPLKGGPDHSVLRLYPVSNAIGLVVLVLGSPLAVDGLGHPFYLFPAVLYHAGSHPLHPQ